MRFKQHSIITAAATTSLFLNNRFSKSTVFVRSILIHNQYYHSHRWQRRQSISSNSYLASNCSWNTQHLIEKHCKQQLSTCNNRRNWALSASSSLSSESKMKNILSIEECLSMYEDHDNVVFVDGSWHLPTANRNARAEFEEGPRMPRARFFDVDDISSKGDLNPKNLPHMMPPASLFAAAMDALDIKNEDRIIVYASKGCFAAPRTWFTFKTMASDSSRVHIMDGGLEEWKNAGGEIETGKPDMRTIRASDLKCYENKESLYSANEPTNVVDMADVLEIIDSNIARSDAVIVDARSPGRFAGKEPEPRPGIRGGHMPKSENLFFLEFHNPDNPLQFKERDEMSKILESHNISPIEGEPKQIISTCGTGVTACSLVLALTECGRDFTDMKIYDGSWTEWGDPESGMRVLKDD